MTDTAAPTTESELYRLRLALDKAEADRATLAIEVERYSEWSNELAGFVPEDYDGSNPEGAQEGIILDWVRDVVEKRDRYRDALAALTRADNQWARDTARDALVSAREEVTAEGYGGELHNGVPLVALGEDADVWTAYGHHPQAQFAEACREYLGEDFVQPEGVQHVYAVMEHRDDWPEDDGWCIRWRGVTASDDKAFPLTVWDADRAAEAAR
jgi:hypothetical protein